MKDYMKARRKDDFEEVRRTKKYKGQNVIQSEKFPKLTVKKNPNVP